MERVMKAEGVISPFAGGVTGWQRKSWHDAKSITLNFRVWEHECSCGQCLFQACDPDLYSKLEEVRELMNRPLRISSGYRCEAHNKKVGGSPKSKHMEGIAVDIAAQNLDHAEHLALAGAAVGFGGIGVYSRWVHLDMRETLTVWGSEYGGMASKLSGRMAFQGILIGAVDQIG